MGGRGASRTAKHRFQLRFYGRFRGEDGRMVGAHQAALILTGSGRPSPSHVASHWRCDVSLCCNFTHLRWDTSEAVEKDRLSRCAITGRWMVAA